MGRAAKADRRGASGIPRGQAKAFANTRRERILAAAFEVFIEHGYSEASTLEIATRAQVSKRELYALVGDKQDLLVACIAGRAARMRWTPEGGAKPRDSATLAQTLEGFGTHLLSEACHPTVISVFRLAIAEANRAPEVARALETKGREANRAPLTEILSEACSSGLLRGEPTELAREFTAFLWGDLMMGLLLQVAASPSASEIRRRANNAARLLLRLHAR